MHHGRRRSSLLPAVTLGVRDKERSSNQPVSRFTTERSLRPLRQSQPQRQPSSPFLSQRVFTLRHRAGPQPKISLLSPTPSQNAHDYSVRSKEPATRCREHGSNGNHREPLRRKIQSRFWHKISLFLSRNTGPGEIISHISCFSSRQHSETVFTARLSGHVRFLTNNRNDTYFQQCFCLAQS